MITVFIGRICSVKGFKEIINFVAPKSKEFYLVGSPQIKNPTMRRLKRHLLRTEYQTEWPGTRFANPDPAGYPVMYFQVSPESIKLLLEEKASLYGWETYYPTQYMPDELGFYRKDGRVLLATVSHEGQGWLKLEKGEFEKLRPILDENEIEYSTDPKYMFWGVV